MAASAGWAGAPRNKDMCVDGVSREATHDWASPYPESLNLRLTRADSALELFLTQIPQDLCFISGKHRDKIVSPSGAVVGHMRP